MIRKVFRAGNSAVVSLPREGLEYLDLREGSSVSVELDRAARRLVIIPVPQSQPAREAFSDRAPAPPLGRGAAVVDAPLIYKRIVAKVGSSVLSAGTDSLHRPRMLDLVRQIASLRELGAEMILVTSGAMLAGRERLGFPRMQKGIPFKQILAAVGQGHLMRLYEQLFDLFDIPVAQALLTREDMADRQRYLNARDTLLGLLERRVVPIVNENDVVAVDEIRVGDNDNISAMVANLLEADLLVMLTDTEGLYTADPRQNPEAKLIPEVEAIDEAIWALAGGSRSSRGTGGMVTKLQAAEMATRSGTRVVVARGAVPEVLVRLACGETIGTAFPAAASHMESRKRWILAEGALRGSIRVDDGAARALIDGGKSLLAVGVVAVEGDFQRGQTVRVVDAQGKEIARGLTRYGGADLKRIRGAHSEAIERILGYEYGAEVIHRNDLVVL